MVRPPINETLKDSSEPKTSLTRSSAARAKIPIPFLQEKLLILSHYLVQECQRRLSKVKAARRMCHGKISLDGHKSTKLFGECGFSIRGYDEATLPAFYLFGLENCLNSPQKSITAGVTQSYQKKAFMTPRGISSKV